MARYPTNVELEAIREWDKPHHELVDFIEEIWAYPEYFKKWNYGGRLKIEMHTAGWSGNEDILGALRESKSLFWMMYWQKEERGGHYWFELPSEKKAISQVKDGLVSLYGK